jgi:type IV secretion system protein TrbI
MDTKPPAEVSLDDMERPAVPAGSPRIVVAFALILCLVLGLVVWGMYKSHKKRVQAAATVPSAMNSQAAQPAESNREAQERLNPPSKKTVVKNSVNPIKPESTPNQTGPVIRFAPAAPTGVQSMPSGNALPAADPGDASETSEQALELAARHAPSTVQFAQGQSNQVAQPLPAVPLPSQPVSPDSALTEAMRAYTTANHPEVPSSVNKQATFTKSEDTAILGRSAPLPPFSLTRGTKIPAIIDKNVNSQLPGQIEAHVSEDVYNSRCGQADSGCFIVIPQGSRLIGDYNTEVGYGQDRLQVAWTKLYFPDTSSVDLGRMAGYANDGAAGLKGKVDNHWKRIISGALLTSVLNIGFSISQSRDQTSGYYPSPGNAAAAGVGTGLTQFGQELTRRNIDIPPFVKIPVGTELNVDVTRDMIFDGPYRSLR